MPKALYSLSAVKASETFSVTCDFHQEASRRRADVVLRLAGVAAVVLLGSPLEEDKLAVAGDANVVAGKKRAASFGPNDLKESKHLDIGFYENRCFVETQPGVTRPWAVFFYLTLFLPEDRKKLDDFLQ